MISNTLGLILQPEDSRLRLLDSATGEVLRTHLESETALRLAEAQARTAEARARMAEDENARLRAEIERLRSGQG